MRWNEVCFNLWDQAVIFILNTSFFLFLFFLDGGLISESEEGRLSVITEMTVTLPGIFILVQNCNYLQGNRASVKMVTLWFVLILKMSTQYQF